MIQVICILYTPHFISDNQLSQHSNSNLLAPALRMLRYFLCGCSFWVRAKHENMLWMLVQWGNTCCWRLIVALIEMALFDKPSKLDYWGINPFQKPQKGSDNWRTFQYYKLLSWEYGRKWQQCMLLVTFVQAMLEKSHASSTEHSHH